MQISIITISLLALLFSISTEAQHTFPLMQTTDASTDSVKLPADLKGKKSIIFLALTPKAEEVLEDWYTPVYTLFIDRSGINAMVYDCHVKLVMLFTGVGKSAADQVMANVRANMDSDFKTHLLFYEGGISKEINALGLDRKHDAYVFVLDEEGRIIFNDKGAYSETKIDQIANLVELD